MYRNARSPFARKRRLFLESLEGRQLMAADLQFAAAPLPELTGTATVGALADPAIDQDVDSLPHVGTFPRIPVSAEAAVGEALAGGLSTAFAPLTGIPALNSLGGAAASLYLDFNGHFDAVWGAYKNITTPVFDQDGNGTSFSDGELTTIRNVWAQVSEDFAPFKINVTTVEPASFANGVSLRVAIGGDGSWLGDEAGGIAYINSFTNSVGNTAYVFPEMLANGYFKYVADASSHEAGHALGLEHQSLFSSTGAIIDEYNPGTSAVGPIMGDSYSSTRGVWSRNYNANRVMQDDLALLSRSVNGFGYRADDHGNSATAASALIVSGSSVAGSGILHQTTDVDYFSFTTGAGQVSLNVSVAQFNNLDARLELRDAGGTLIASAAPTTSFGASINTTLAEGSYRLVVASQGYYGDLGQYTVSGTVVPVAVTPVSAPSGLTATAVTATQVNLSWSNVAGETGYRVERLAGGVWTQIGTTAADVVAYQDKTAAAGVTYSYRVRAFNAGGESAASALVSVTTPAVVTRPNAPSALYATINANRQVQLTWRDNSNNETVFVVQRWTNGSTWTTLGQVPANSTATVDATAARGRVYYYRVYAYNSAGYSAASNSSRITTPYFASRAASTSSTTSASSVKLPAIQPFTGKASVVQTASVATTARATANAGQSTSAGQAGAVSDTTSEAGPQGAAEWQSAVDAVFGGLRKMRAGGRP